VYFTLDSQRWHNQYCQHTWPLLVLLQYLLIVNQAILTLPYHSLCTAVPLLCTTLAESIHQPRMILSLSQIQFCAKWLGHQARKQLPIRCSLVDWAQLCWAAVLQALLKIRSVLRWTAMWAATRPLVRSLFANTMLRLSQTRTGTQCASDLLLLTMQLRVLCPTIVNRWKDKLKYYTITNWSLSDYNKLMI